MTQNLNMFNEKLQYKHFWEKKQTYKIRPGRVSPLNFIWGSDIKRGIHEEEKDPVIEIKRFFNIRLMNNKAYFIYMSIYMYQNKVVLQK